MSNNSGSKNKKETIEKQKKSRDTSKIKDYASKGTHKNVQKTGTKDDNWDDPTGNTHLGNKS